ncbi:hypothetical protein Gpo141_00001694 [Globisporangium polare]
MATTAAAAAASRRVCFLTDAEGNWAYVRNFVRQSTCLRFKEQAQGTSPAGAGAEVEEELELRDDCFLVFGGDAGDKGGETLQCYEQLVRLKKKYPDRVVLLVGNRDVNKMRLTSELDDSEMDFDTMDREIYEGPIWVPQDKRVSIKSFLARQIKSERERKGEKNDPDDGVVDDQLLQAANTKVNRLKWMLEHTMGAQGDFERRRKEIASRANNLQATAPSDENVLQSYLDSVRGGGVLREYLELGSLAFTAHNTLFVHGGIINGATSSDGDGSTSSLGRVPNAPSTHYRSVTEWVEQLNAWYQSEVQAWIDQPTWTPDRTTRGGNELLKYALPGYPESVIMGRHLQSSGMPTRLPVDVAQHLSESGIKRLIVGHTPHGNCPTVIKQKKIGGVADVLSPCFEEVIMCDTSYSNMKADDNRGDAAAELVLNVDGRVHIHGVLEDQRSIAFASDDPIIGRELRDGTQVKAKLAASSTDGEEEDEYLVYSVKNAFLYTYHYRKLHELVEIGFSD